MKESLKTINWASIKRAEDQTILKLCNLLGVWQTEKSEDTTIKIWCQENNFNATNPIQTVGYSDLLQGISL